MKTTPRGKSGSAPRPSFTSTNRSHSSRSEPRKAGGSFDKKPRSFSRAEDGDRKEGPSKKYEPRKSTGSFDDKPKRYDRAEGGDRKEGFKKYEPRKSTGSFDDKPKRYDRAEGGERKEGGYAKKPAYGRSAPASSGSGGKPYEKKYEPRKPAGSFDDKPKRFVRGEGGAPAEGKRPAYGRSAPASSDSRAPRDKKYEPRKAGSFDHKPRRFDRSESSERPSDGYKPTTPRFAKKPDFKKKFDKPRAAATPAAAATVRTDKAIFRKRESLQRQGVLLWGLHAVREAWLNPNRTCYRLWATTTGLDALEGALKEATEAQLTRPAPLTSDRTDIEHFLPPGSVHQGVALEVEPLAETTLDDLLGLETPPELVVVLDQVTDPHNIGAILRSAAAFGAGAVIVSERNAPGTTGTMAKSACGAVEHVPLVAVVNIARTLDALKEESYWCIGLAEEGDKELSAAALSTGRIALVMGAEGDGLRRLTREHCDELARLPTGGKIASLNVSNAAAIALYETVRQRKGVIES